MAYRLSLSLINNWAGLILLLLAAFLPVYGPVMAYVEGAALPVTSPIEVFDVKTEVDGTLSFRFKFTKYRACEYLGTAWTIRGAQVDAHPLNPLGTRAPGAQASNRWAIDATSLDGSEVWFIHRCGFAWLTATKVLG